MLDLVFSALQNHKVIHTHTHIRARAHNINKYFTPSGKIVMRYNSIYSIYLVYRTPISKYLLCEFIKRKKTLQNFGSLQCLQTLAKALERNFSTQVLKQ